MRREVMRTCGSGRSDSSIVSSLASFSCDENAPCFRWALRRRGLSPSGTLGDNIRSVGIEDPLDLILEVELSPLEARDLELFDRGPGRQGRDLLIERPVFGFQRL